MIYPPIFTRAGGIWSLSICYVQSRNPIRLLQIRILGLRQIWLYNIVVCCSREQLVLIVQSRRDHSISLIQFSRHLSVVLYNWICLFITKMSRRNICGIWLSCLLLCFPWLAGTTRTRYRNCVRMSLKASCTMLFRSSFDTAYLWLRRWSLGLPNILTCIHRLTWRHLDFW